MWLPSHHLEETGQSQNQLKLNVNGLMIKNQRLSRACIVHLVKKKTN
jgi:hypothetical protein